MLPYRSGTLIQYGQQRLWQPAAFNIDYKDISQVVTEPFFGVFLLFDRFTHTHWPVLVLGCRTEPARCFPMSRPHRPPLQAHHLNIACREGMKRSNGSSACLTSIKTEWRHLKSKNSDMDLTANMGLFPHKITGKTSNFTFKLARETAYTTDTD